MKSFKNFPAKSDDQKLDHMPKNEFDHFDPFSHYFDLAKQTAITGILLNIIFDASIDLCADVPCTSVFAHVRCLMKCLNEFRISKGKEMHGRLGSRLVKELASGEKGQVTHFNVISIQLCSLFLDFCFCVSCEKGMLKLLI